MLHQTPPLDDVGRIAEVVIQSLQDAGVYPPADNVERETVERALVRILIDVQAGVTA